MSATIMMPTSIESAIKIMCEDAVTQAVASLAEKYGFEPETAMRELNLGELKLVRKRGPSPKLDKADKAEKSKGKKDDKPKVKRGPTGYLLYAADVRPSVKEELAEELEEGQKLKPQATVTEIARRWKALSDEERGEWNERAKSPATSDAESEAPSEAQSEPQSKPKAESKKVEKKDVSEEKPKTAKRGPTGYLLYAASVRPTVKAELTEALEEGTKLKPQEVVVEIAKRWKALDDDEREEWVEQAKSGDDSSE